MPKIDVESDLPKLEKKVDALVKEAGKINTENKKRYAEFENLNGALWEGKKMIEDSQKALKKEKDTKKVKALADEIEEQEKTFKKISAKIPGIRKNVESTMKDAENCDKDLKSALDEIAALNKALTRTAGFGDDLKEMAKQLKDLEKKVDKAREIVGPIATGGLPNTPKL